MDNEINLQSDATRRGEKETSEQGWSGEGQRGNRLYNRHWKIKAKWRLKGNSVSWGNSLKRDFYIR